MLKPRALPMWGTVITSSLAAAATEWSILRNSTNALTPTVAIVILSVWAACFLALPTQYIAGRWRETAGVALIAILWCAYMFFFNEVAYFGPAIGCGTWWIVALQDVR